ncbi:C-type lectin domain family 5 member A [Paroedura picta]|uniref:C-type lectin domain family 5 member A n=1 Tax=Paroedura picta TaxID=143630 RepID=UPI0040562031
MNWNLMIQVVTTVILKVITSSLFLIYYPQIFYAPVQQENIEVTPKECPVRWQIFKAKCYLFTTASQNWEDSQNNCAQFSSHLTVIDSKEELMFLKNKTMSERYFIGLTKKDGNWIWTDNTAFDPTIFHFNKRDVQCVGIGFNSVDSVSCSIRHRSICEKNA